MMVNVKCQSDCINQRRRQYLSPFNPDYYRFSIIPFLRLCLHRIFYRQLFHYLKPCFMKKLHALLLISFAGLISVAVTAQQITTPRTPSPAATVSQTIGISKIVVNYSRPSVKGREVWGKLVPY